MTTKGEVIRCDKCGSIISERQISLFKGMVGTLWRIFKWCEERNQHEFTRKEIKHLIKTDNEIARFGDWVLFGGLVYKPDGKGSWGVNMQRARDFFSGTYAIPTVVWKNPITGQIRKEQERFIRDIPYLKTFLDENETYIAVYREPIQQTFI